VERIVRLGRQLSPVVPVAAVVAVAFGMAGVVVGMNLRINNPQVQAGIVGATAGIVGGLIGASVGAWSAGRVADRSLEDSRAAREEAREEARQTRFLDERRTAITDLLLDGEWSVEVAQNRARGGPAAMKEPLPPREGPGVDRAMAAMSLVAPDLAIGAGANYRAAVRKAVYACVEWGSHPDSGGGERRVMPDAVAAALEEHSRARARFVSDAVFHLGVNDYIQDTLKRIIAEDAKRTAHDQGGPNDE
jgi:gas vesicle protein